MIIYNVTTNIQNGVHDEWLKWMKEIHIPQVLATGKFIDAKLSRVVVQEDSGKTYSVQFTCENRELLQQYYREHAPNLRADSLRLFADQALSFRTELEVISHHKI